MFKRSFSKSSSAFLPVAAKHYVACNTNAGESARRPDAVSGGKPLWVACGVRTNLPKSAARLLLSRLRDSSSFLRR